MGWFGGNKKTEEEPEKETATRPVSDSAAPDQSSGKPSRSTDAEPADLAESEPEGTLPAVFEFGGPAVESGVQMKGICSVDDPNQIQACLWRVDPVPSETPKDESRYQILF